MDASFFLRGMIIGLSIAAVVGPMSILCIQRTLSRGHLYGLVSGLGIATADAVYSSIAAFGLTGIADLLISQQGWLRLIGGLFLVYLGIKTILSKPAKWAATAQANNFLVQYPQTDRSNGETLLPPSTLADVDHSTRETPNRSSGFALGAYVSMLLLTLTNPLTILSFAAIFAGLGVGGASKSYLAATLVVCGVFAGSALWWCLLTSGISLLRQKFTPLWLLWINRLSGAVITVFGVFVLYSLI